MTGAKLQALRRTAGINQTDMGAMIDATRHSVSYWETSHAARSMGHLSPTTGSRCNGLQMSGFVRFSDAVKRGPMLRFVEFSCAAKIWPVMTFDNVTAGSIVPALLANVSIRPHFPVYKRARS
jgi:hypothetical protein